MTLQEGFINRLRWYRQRSLVTLGEIAETMQVQRELLEEFENHDLARWPRGLYARAWVRGYATAVGLDPVDTVEEFCRLFPHGDRRAQDTIQGIAAIVASPSEYRDEFSHEDRRRTPEINMMPKSEWHGPITQAGKTLMIRLNALRAAPSMKPRQS